MIIILTITIYIINTSFDYVNHNKLWKILKETGIPDHLTCLLRNLYAGQEATARTGHGTTDWFQIRKGVRRRVVSSAYLRLLKFLQAILIPACASSSPAFLMMYAAYKLNKQGDNIQLWRTAFPIWNQSVVPCSVLTVFPDLHTDFSRDKSGGLVFPSL